ncbi:head fiber protein [Clostridium sp.]|uniref:head fiber protein n=1 Tax=Clostridium sp. TaxID=1506 RepID=UPI002909DADF|nr:head fiber protein [Clostridium sp.]MDU3410117.1 head fiber protein [Clostridium sp.]
MGFFGTTAISGGGSGGGITQEELDLQLATKVDVVNGKGLSTNDYTTAEKTKLSGIATSANNYVHPTTHPASVIVQDASNRFVTDTEKATWNGKADTTAVTTTTNGLMISTDKTKLDGVATGANNYTHPANHPSTIITQTATARFVTDTEKATWNGKADNVGATTTTLGLVKKCEAQADSEATDIDTLKADFNSLLTKLKSAGLM